MTFPAADGERVAAVRGVDLDLRRGEITGLVGESGAGKSLTALALLRLVPPPGQVEAAVLEVDEIDLLKLDAEEMRQIRGRQVGFVFQEPQSALNPVFTVGAQIREAVRAHRALRRREAHGEALRLLELVSISDARSIVRAYPHQLSGGQRQRVMLAIALANQPDLLVADEPTTALDVTVQAQILDLLSRLRDELGIAVLLITHDLAVVAEICHRVLVMYAGEIVEEGDVADVYTSPAHPYTQGLLSSLPRLGGRTRRLELPFIAGRIPEPGERPAGCAFHPRCPLVIDRCRSAAPDLRCGDGARSARCHLAFSGSEPRD